MKSVPKFEEPETKAEGPDTETPKSKKPKTEGTKTEQPAKKPNTEGMKTKQPKKEMPVKKEPRATPPQAIAAGSGAEEANAGASVTWVRPPMTPATSLIEQWNASNTVWHVV